MDLGRIAAMRELLAATGWVDRTRHFGRSLRSAGHRPGGLLVVGTPTEEPWHLAAHLDEESRWTGLAELAPTLVRWQPPPGAPPHLAIGLERLESAGRGETVFVVAPDDPTPELLERVSDARHDGATVLALDGGDRELEDLAHDALVVPLDDQRTETGLVLPDETGQVIPDVLPVVSFDMVGHLVSVAAGEPEPVRQRSVRRGLARMLDALSGPRPGAD